MIEPSAVIFLPDDTIKTGLDCPLMLQPVMGAPLLAWLTESMASEGTQRFFLICSTAYAEQARSCFPEGSQLTICADQDPADLLHVFLSTTPMEEQTISVITGPVVFLPEASCRPEAGAAPRRASACRTSRRLMMEALDDEMPFGQFLLAKGEAYTDWSGYYSVSSMADLVSWQKAIGKDRLLRLVRKGVRIWDMDNCYVDPRSAVHIGTELLPGTILRGSCRIGGCCTIGPNSLLENARVGDEAVVNASQVYDSEIATGCHVGPFSHIRPGTTLARGAKAGAFVELKNANLGKDVKVSHLSYLGDSDVGDGTNIGCGVVTANFDRVKKHRTTLGAESFVGCNTCLVAPVTVGDKAYIAAGSVITQDVPGQALGIARSRQLNKKDWAAKHKK